MFFFLFVYRFFQPVQADEWKCVAAAFRVRKGENYKLPRQSAFCDRGGLRRPLGVNYIIKVASRRWETLSGRTLEACKSIRQCLHAIDYFSLYLFLLCAVSRTRESLKRDRTPCTECTHQFEELRHLHPSAPLQKSSFSLKEKRKNQMQHLNCGTKCGHMLQLLQLSAVIGSDLFTA